MIISKGDTLRPFAPQIMQDTATPFNLTGYTVDVTIVRDDGSVKGGGAMTVSDAANGKCYYPFAAGDVDVPGSYGMHVKYTQTSTGKFDHLEKELLIVEWAP